MLRDCCFSHAPAGRLYATGLLHQGGYAPLRGFALDPALPQQLLLAGGMREEGLVDRGGYSVIGCARGACYKWIFIIHM